MSSILNSVMGSVVNVNDELKEHNYHQALQTTLVFLVYMVLLGIFGEYLWNNVAKKLIPNLGKAKWSDVLLLNVLLQLLLSGPNL